MMAVVVHRSAFDARKFLDLDFCHFAIEAIQQLIKTI